uniref:Putative secreted peptide n=1 Tax=Anopheles braziliensis TaxID=58242 RepID=A0A2M3ZN88_9DIPT
MLLLHMRLNLLLLLQIVVMLLKLILSHGSYIARVGCGLLLHYRLLKFLSQLLLLLLLLLLLKIMLVKLIFSHYSHIVWIHGRMLL